MRHKTASQVATACNWVISIDSYAQGLSLIRKGIAESQSEEGWQELLGLGGEPRQLGLRSRYALGREQSRVELENQFRNLSLRGILQRSVLVIGIETDPFHPFDTKFNASMALLELLGRYPAGRVVVQTRSPLIVIGLPVLKALRCPLSVTVGLETSDEEEARRWTPELPRVEERIKLLRSLRRFGIHCGVQVSPLLPYGDWERDARPFAELLGEHCDYVLVRSLSREAERNGRGSVEARIARKLADSRRFHWLRNDATRPLIEALDEVGGGRRLTDFQLTDLPERQLRLFE